MSTEKTQTRSDIGAGTAKSLSIPQLDPVFSFPVEGGGLILVYVFETSVSKIALATLDDGYSEEAYAVSSIHSANTGINLTGDAVERFQQIARDQPNPFRQLLENREALGELNNKLAQIFYKGE